MTDTPVQNCPACLIAAPASGQGKTTVTAALAWRYREQGRAVRVFKVGPDFLDPTLLEAASGHPVYQLDLWMGGEAHCRHLLAEAAAHADVILIEGVMGLFDGQPSSADVAARFGMPVLLVIDAGAMAQTFGAVAHGLASFRPDLSCTGVIANRVAGERHYEMLAESLPAGIDACGWLPRDPELALPERHLGLVPATELSDCETRIGRAARALRGMPAALPPAVAFPTAPAPAVTPRLSGVRIAIAHDEAFAFVYRANVDMLLHLGAEVVFFSPLHDASPPAADALYLPGGYPELHGRRLAANRAMAGAIRAHHAAGKPIVAECGGMLYLLESVTGQDGRRVDMAGLLPGHAVLQERPANIGLQAITLPEGTLRGHTFHYSRMETALTPVAQSTPARPGRRGEPWYRQGRLHASYLHLYFPSNPLAAGRLFTPTSML